ncbi:hypothetical protein DPV78_003397 [Talaromyces pinophilus]|nr:hypothetical protein DPV78_003397 [Talaromyces pinophilus]
MQFDIVGCFKDKCFHENESFPGVQTDPEKMPLHDLMNLWAHKLEDCEDDSFSDNVPFTGVKGNQDQNSNKDDVISHDASIFTSAAGDMMSQHSDAGAEQEENEEAIMPQLLEYKGFIFKAPAYKWLLASIRREFLLASAEPNVMESIRKTIVTSLPSSHKISRKTSSAAYKVTFVVRWNPLAFVNEREYKEEQDEAIGRAITLTGSAGDAQALTCAQYLSQTWPSSGSHIIQLIKDVVRAGPDNQRTCKFLNLNYYNSDSNYVFQGDLPDNTEITAWIHESNFMVEVFGTGDSLAEVGEQFAWLGAALRSSPYELGVNHCTPLISDIHINKALQQVPGILSESHIICEIDFTFEEREKQSVVANGQCWHNLFRNPVIVKGFPILRRPQACTGLEISLKMMIALTQARFVTTFDNKIFIKGFSTMLVPTEIEREMVTWHLLFNTDGSHISYTSPQVQKLPGFYPAEITMSGLETCRHVVGWCSSVQNHTGTSTAAYHLIDWSGLENSQEGCDFEKLYISRGRLITRGIEPAIGRQDVPLHVGFDVYMRQLKWIAGKFIVLYDVEARRAWLVDGASALLHLVRTSIEHSQNDKFKDDFIFKWNMIKEANFSKGSSAAISVLMNDRNKELELYSSSNYRFKDRVEQICHTLEQVLTHQEEQINLENFRGSGLRHANQKILEGFDFMDIATEEDHFWARMTHVQRGGTGWTYFTRAIHAATLFGNGFGELITPCDTANVCPSWTEVPKGQEYLAVCVSMVQEILRKKGNTRDLPWRIARDLYWYTPGKTFEECQCAGTSTRTPCDRAQILLHKQQLRYKEKLLSSPSELKTDGAVIFGFTQEITLLVDDSDGLDEGRSSSRAEDSGSKFIDSALGRSLSSSTSTHILRDEIVKRGREPDWPSIPSAKRLHALHHPSKPASLQKSLTGGNGDEYNASPNFIGGLGKKVNKGGKDFYLFSNECRRMVLYFKPVLLYPTLARNLTTCSNQTTNMRVVQHVPAVMSMN